MRYPTSRDEQAAYWHLKLQEPEVSADEIQAALDWQAEPQNRAAFDRVAAFWNAWPARPRIPRAETQIPPGRPMPWRAAAALVLAMVLGAGFFLYPRSPVVDVVVREYATPVGQIDTVLLPDGTKAVLGAATSIHVRFADDVRHVQLAGGEALFEVAKDAERPFVVEMPNGSARALGTQFIVHRGPDEATVTVLEGRVRVTPPEWRAGAPVDVVAGHQVALETDGTLGRVLAVDLRDAGSWRAGRLVFAERTLRSVVADLNRYSQQPVIVADASLADLRISGTVKVDQLDAWLEALGIMLDARLVRDEDGVTLER